MPQRGCIPLLIGKHGIHRQRIVEVLLNAGAFQIRRNLLSRFPHRRLIARVLLSPRCKRTAQDCHNQ
jgi:hypothetical protein